MPRETREGKNYPVPPVDNISPPIHAFAGFYIQYPDDERCPPERGLVSTIQEDPPVLNWIYCDRDTYELRYGNRTASIQHIVGDWDWTDNELNVLLDGWEGFIAVDESSGMSDEEWEQTEWGKEGLRWAVYFDVEDNGLEGKLRRKSGKGKKNNLEVILERRCQSAEEQLKQLEEADKKMQVKSRGDLKTQFTAPAAELRKKKEAAGK